MFQSTGLVSHPLCQRAGTPAMRHIEISSIETTPQSPRLFTRPCIARHGMIAYSSSAAHGTLASIQR
jgi:hypothetical protein